MTDFIIFTIGGLATASIYAITASGLTLTYATTGIFNWSHGAIGMLAAYAYWQMHIGWGWPILVSFAVCLFVLAPVLGIVLEVGVMRRLEGTSEAAKLVVTLALALSMVGIAEWIWDPQTYRALPRSSPATPSSSAPSAFRTMTWSSSPSPWRWPSASGSSSTGRGWG